jgi:ribonuclease J
LLSSEIPVYATATTTFLAKAIQDSGKADFEQRICYFSPLSAGCPKGCRQVALLSGSDARQQRQFHIADADLKALTSEALKFWEFGFWEKTARQKDIAACQLKSHLDCRFELRCFPVDHSIPGACAWGIETSSGWIIYSGDLRLHGKRGKLTEKFVEEAAKLHPRAFIIEGTNAGRETNVSEREVYENGLKAISHSNGLVIADFQARDIDRLLTLLQVARESKRKLAILPRDAYLLKTMSLVEGGMPDLASDESLVIYQDTTAAKSPNQWLQNIYRAYEDKVVLARDVRSAQDEFILCFSFFDLNELPSISPKPGALYVFSSSEPHDEEQEIDFRRLHNWLKHFEMKGFGLPVEGSEGWVIPENEKGLHASGHACGPDLLRIASEVNPEIVIPVHSEHPGFYTGGLRSRGSVKVIVPSERERIIEF